MPRLDNRLTKNELKNYSKHFDTGRIYMAKVMDTRNVSRAGEILVHVIGGDGEENNPEDWLTAAYASSFFGTTPYSGSPNEKNDKPTFETSPKSFGAWFPIPCVGNYVFIFFPVSTGETTNAYWFSCPVNPNVDYMIPGIPGAYFNDEHKALTERKEKIFESKVNKKYNQNISDGEQVQSEYDPLNLALKRQGLENDGIRGYSTAGAKRERPSMCYGILTPLGNSFVMDDGWLEEDNKTEWNFSLDNNSVESGDIKEKRELIDSTGNSPFNRKYGDEKDKRNNAGFRFRTRNGTQIMIQDDGTIYMINSEGTCWVEISDDGYLEAFSKKGVNVASEGDVNIHTKGNIFLESDETIALKGKSVKIEASGDLDISANHMNSQAIISAEEILAKKGNISSFVSGAATINGTFQGFLKGTAYYSESQGMFPENLKNKIIETPNANVNNPTPQEINEIKISNDENAEPLMTINTRVPTHEPYYGHNKTKPNGELKPITDNNYQGTNNKTGTCGGSSDCGNNSQSKIVKSSDNGEKVTNQPEIGKKSAEALKNNEKPKQNYVPRIQISDHFSLRQLCYSDYANNKNIPNIPNEIETNNLSELSKNVLEPVLERFGKVEINSGFRGKELSKKIGDINSSQHESGQAIDINVPGVSNLELANWIKNNVTYDQLILENASNLEEDPNSGWVHISYNSKNNRKQDLTVKSDSIGEGLHQ